MSKCLRMPCLPKKICDKSEFTLPALHVGTTGYAASRINGRQGLLDPPLRCAPTAGSARDIN